MPDTGYGILQEYKITRLQDCKITPPGGTRLEDLGVYRMRDPSSDPEMNSGMTVVSIKHPTSTDYLADAGTINSLCTLSYERETCWRLVQFIGNAIGLPCPI